MSGYYPYGGVGMGGIPSQPDYSAALARIQGMTNEQLQELIDNEEKCEELIKSLDQIKSLYSEKEMLLASNKSLAEYNLSQEPKLRESRSRLQEKHRDAVRMTEKVRNLKAEVDSKAGKMEPDVLLALLQAAGAEAEEVSEKVAEEYMAGRMKDVDQFLDEFMKTRKLSHLRRIKIDKMKELLEKEATNLTPVRRAPPAPSRPAAAPAVYAPPQSNWGAAPYPANNLPYPIHPVGMPSGPGASF